MTTPGEHQTDTLLERASAGDQSAVAELLSLHRPRLRQMVAVRMDPRLNARVDPSDVVQDVFTEASQAFDDFVRDRPLPFYPWLRQLAWQRLYDLHVRHVRSQKRSTTREAVTDSKGVFKFADLVPGTYDIEITYPEYMKFGNYQLSNLFEMQMAPR